ncbi:unnamed protein product [Pedinophyceae sp. YPF-701]|nr:unnamed protein product [Pedinophyceae sp. YPF-701]
MPRAATTGPRFVCVPSDETLIGFKTVRARPRPQYAAPEIETMLNVPAEDLEELLTTAIAHADDFIKAAGTEDPSRRLDVLVRVEAESSTRSRDIQATSLFLPDDLEQVCEALCVPGRALRKRTYFDGDQYAALVLWDAAGETYGPTNCMTMLNVGLDFAVREQLALVRGARDAVHQAHEDKDAAASSIEGTCQHLDLQLTLEHAYGARLERSRLPPSHRHLEQPFVCQAVVGICCTWVWTQPRAIRIERCGLEGAEQAVRDTERIIADMGEARRTAQEVVRGLRETGILRSLCADALVPAAPGSVAAHSSSEDWDPAGRHPAVSLNVILGSPHQPVVFLTLPEGMRWRKWTPSDWREQPCVGLVAEISDPEAFCRPLPAPVPWTLLTDKLAQHRATLRSVDVSEEWVRAGLMSSVVYGCTTWMRSPGTMAELDRNITANMVHQFGNRYLLEPRFKIKASDDAVLAFETVRIQARPDGTTPAMETFLNVPEDELDELVQLTMHRAKAFVQAPDLPPTAVWAVVTRFETECWARSSDIKAVTTMPYLWGRSVDAFCRMISTEGRKLHVGKGSDGSARVYVTLRDGILRGRPLDCTSLIGDRRSAFAAFQDAAKASNLAQAGDAERLLCFREGIELERPRGTLAFDVVGTLTKEHPDKITVGVWRDPKLSEHLEAEDEWVYTLELCELQGALLKALRRPGALRTVCDGALLHPHDQAAAREAPEQAWDDQGRFPAVSLNICWYQKQTYEHLGQLWWLELPPGMRWQPAAGHHWERGLLTRVTPVVAEVVSEQKLNAATRRAQPETWDSGIADMIATGTEMLRARPLERGAPEPSEPRVQA